jgi:Nuclease-related domain
VGFCHPFRSWVGQTELVNGRNAEEGDDKPEWRDLANNRPGQAARQVALDRRQAAPVKTFIARLLRVHSNERAWRVGAEGEEEVARHLARLGEGWRVLHSIPIGEKGSDIDHVVIGPAGVFTLNTKNHIRGNVWVTENVFMVNGQKREYFRNSRHEAKRASSLLSAACGFEVPVEPIIVVMAAKLIIKSRPADVRVVGRKTIRKWLTQRCSILSPDRVEEIYGYARRDLTWSPGPK